MPSGKVHAQCSLLLAAPAYGFTAGALGDFEVSEGRMMKIPEWKSKGAWWILALLLISPFAAVYIWMGFPPLAAVILGTKSFSVIVAIAVFFYIWFASRRK